jgi:hypothetical protein
MIDVSRKVIVVADVVVPDAELSAEHRAMLEDAGIEVVPI